METDLKLQGRFQKAPRSIEPTHEGRAAIYMTAHASRRLIERFGLRTLKKTPFTLHTLFCESDDVDRPVWAFRVNNGTEGGYILGRWELADPERALGNYTYWFVGTTVITNTHFRQSHLYVNKSVNVRIIRVINELKTFEYRDRLAEAARQHNPPKPGYPDSMVG